MFRSRLFGIVVAVTGLAAVWWLGPAARAHRNPASSAPLTAPADGNDSAATKPPGTVVVSALPVAAATAVAPAAGSDGAVSLLVPRYEVPSHAEQYRRIATWEHVDAAPLVAAEKGAILELPLFDGRIVRARVNAVQVAADGQRILAGELLDGVAGTFAFGVGADGAFGGQIFPTTGTSAFVVETGRDGRLWLLEREKENVVCTEFPPPPAAGPDEAVVATDGDGSEFLLSSRPTAPAVIYIDFDGETVTDPLWNGGATIVAEPSGLNGWQIVDAWRRVAEDYRPFNVDVTTNRARYDATPAKRRMRCIVTTSNGWFGSVGGVAYTSSWRQSGSGSFSSTIPCWAFTNLLAGSPRNIAEAVSHEIGHTLGLSHDGVKDAGGSTTAAYYTGHAAGSTGWAPIMGMGYFQNLVQWSKGEYPGANNREDDLVILTSYFNGVIYLADDAAATTADASALRFGADGAVDTVGLIGRSDDVDAYAFITTGGLVSFTFSAEAGGDAGAGLSNLDVRATLYDAAGQVVAGASPSDSLAADFSAVVAPGTYYLVVEGTGEGTLPDGYSRYGSMGRYAIAGTVPVVPGVAPVVFGISSVSVLAGSAVSYAIEANGAPTTYTASGLPAGLTLNASTGLIEGVPPTPGEYAVVVGATNAFGTGSRTVTFAVTSVLGAFVESATLPWTTGETAPWYTEYSYYHNGVTSLRSSPISANGESWLETTVTGAGALTFWWKVSSEAGADFLRFQVDGVEVAAIAGAVDWTLVTRAIPAGTHTLRWRYTKNNKTNSGSDAGWIDGVTYVKTAVTPSITSAPNARCILGQTFSYQIVAENSPTSYGAIGLPAGLSVDPLTGLISGQLAEDAPRGMVATSILAANSAGTGAASFSLEVVTGFAAWTGDASLAGESAAAAADPDGDGVPNLLEYAFARAPLAAEPLSVGLPQVTLVDDGSGPNLVAVFVLPANRPDIVYTVQVSSDLVSWENGTSYGSGALAPSGALPTEEISRAGVPGGQEIVVRDRNAGGSPRRFMRVAVSAR